MPNEVTTPPAGSQADDGFSVSSRSHRVGRGSFLKWNDKQGWIDRDGVAPPSPLLVVGVNEILRRWKDGVAEDIVEKPLPDPDELNAAIPVREWEVGVDGKPRAPWAHTVVVYLVNLATGETYTYAAATVGAHIAVEGLKEAVITMRAFARHPLHAGRQPRRPAHENEIWAGQAAAFRHHRLADARRGCERGSGASDGTAAPWSGRS